jgi:hypothetical protein
MNKLKASRGQVGFMQNKAIALVVLGIVVGIGLQILDQTQTAIGTAGTTTSEAYNATGDMVTAVGNFSDWYTIIVIVIAGAIILSLLGMFTGSASGKGM